MKQTVNVGNCEINCMSFGSGTRDMVIIPGLSVTELTEAEGAIASAFEIFSREFRVWLMDRMKPVHEGVTVRELAEAQAEAMTALGIRNACVFGASQGGMMAQVIAAAHPELVGKLVLGSTASRMSEGSEKLILEWASLAEAGDRAALAESFVRHVYSESTRKQGGSALLHILDPVSQEELDRFALIARACRGFDITPELRRITCPALVIGAREDRVVGFSATEELADALKCSSFSYEDYGHAVYDEAPDYRERMKTFFLE